MFSLFLRKARPAAGSFAPTEPALEPGFTAPQNAKSLLDTPRRQKLLEQIWQRTAVSRGQFEKLYLHPINQYAELVQLLPASESHHHAYPGGMLDHGLEVIAYALKLRQSHLLPSGAQPEVQIAQAEAWTAALVYAALGHDVGKIAVDVHVECANGSTWHPWHGPLTSPYRFRYQKDRQYRLHGAASGLLIHLILDQDILDWLCTFPALWRSLIFNWAGQSEHAGELGTLISQADQASVAQALGGDPAKALLAPKHALQRKLLEGLRYLVTSELKLNQPQASDGWLTHDALWLVSKTVSDKLRAHLLSQGVNGIPEGNIAVFNVLQEHGILLPTSEGKAVWNATVTSDSGWTHSLSFLKLSPALIWNSGAYPAAFTGTVTIEKIEREPAKPKASGCPSKSLQTKEQNKSGDSPYPAPLPHPEVPGGASHDSLDSLMDLFGGPPDLPDDLEAIPINEPESAPLPQATPAKPIEVSGEHFMEWLTQGVRSHRIIINDKQALVHTVDDTLFLVTPGIFKRYAREYPQLARMARKEKQHDWQWIQKRFEEMKLHRKQNTGLNIWTCEVSGARRTQYLHGYLLSSHHGLMNDLALNNPFLKVTDQAPRKPNRAKIGHTQ